MRKIPLLFAAALLGWASSNALAGTQVRLDTSLGPITLELADDKAPKTVENFLAYAREGFYNGTIFHRVIDGFMIQGGGFTADFQQKPTRAPVKNEADNGLKNLRGTVAMARTSDPQSATAQFFINVKDNPALDYRAPDPQGWGYAVFGQVVGSMEVVDKIRQTPTGAGGPDNRFRDVPTMPVIIQSVTVLPATSPATEPAAAAEPVKKSSP
ncbi:MAG: peptidyl-prolyl cis-trans isomerase [Proteobacteria bacterium]|nr:peptidyl-prolyl cis-trans isomerase [Pseudomonadota bacterium]